MQKKYFITGATGAVGSALIPLILEESDCLLWLLLRADSEDHLTDRLNELIAFWNMDNGKAADVRRRIVAVRGDTDQINFAMTEEQYAEIVRQCTHIIHCAGVVRMNLPLEVARQHALGSAKNVVKLALACKANCLQKIEFVSTVGVAGRTNGLIPETWITQPRTFHNTYEQSKAEAESYLQEQIERHDLPITVHRPSMVVGDSQTGKIIHFQIFYYLCEFISGRQSLGILPSLRDAVLDTVPVDYVAASIKWSADHEVESSGKIFHLCSGPDDAIRLSELRNIVLEQFRSQGLKLPVAFSMPSAFFTVILNTITPFLSEKMRRPLKALPIFLDYLQDRQLFDNEKTLAFFAERSGPKLLPTGAYIKTIINAYIHRKYS